MLSSQAVGPKLEWVRRHEPEVFARATRWYGSNSYIAAKLTGEYVMDHHTASQCDPLYATRRLRLESPNGHSAFAGIFRCRGWSGPARSSAPWTQAAAAATGMPAGTPVVAGTVDAYAEAFSVGVRRPGDRMLMYGSTMFLVQIIDAYFSDPVLWTTAGVERETLALAAGTSTAGSLIGWLQTITGGAPFDDLDGRGAARFRPAARAWPYCPTSPANAPRSSTRTLAGWFAGPDPAARPRTPVSRCLRRDFVRYPADPGALRRRPAPTPDRGGRAVGCAVRCGRRS